MEKMTAGVILIVQGIILTQLDDSKLIALSLQ